MVNFKNNNRRGRFRNNDRNFRRNNDGVKYKFKQHELGLIVIFKNYLKNLNLDWDISGVQKVLELHIHKIQA